jgi:hypothetical protein
MDLQVDPASATRPISSKIRHAAAIAGSGSAIQAFGVFTAAADLAASATRPEATAADAPPPPTVLGGPIGRSSAPAT